MAEFQRAHVITRAIMYRTFVHFQDAFIFYPHVSTIVSLITFQHRAFSGKNTKTQRIQAAVNAEWLSMLCENRAARDLDYSLWQNQTIS